MLIYHCVSLHKYELRHSWEVSSIVEQYGEHLPEIHLDVATLRGYRTKLRYPEGLAHEKNEHVTLTYHPTRRDTFAYRGFVRNEQIKRGLAAGADWFFFADADRVYHPGFFSALALQLRIHANCKLLIAQRLRLGTEREATDKMLAGCMHEHPHHYNAFFRAMQLPIAVRRNYRLASGGMQIISRARLEEVGGIYARVGRKVNDQNMFTQGQLARSDIYFRWHVGGTQLVPLPASCHLEHLRDKEAGQHLDVQR